MRSYTPFINVSSIISAYCYSLFRAEPYADCEHGCLYCYARWRRRGSGPIYGAPRQFAAIASKIRRRDLKPIPVRLSTLTDPFQPYEHRYRLSLRILRWALRLGYPIIVNTKGVMMAEGRWLETLRELASEGLVVVQISLSTLKRDWSLRFEPGAPPPERRLEAASKLSALDIPVAFRLSPYIPGLTSRPSPEKVAEELHKAGARHVVVEAIRVERGEAKKLNLIDQPLEAYSLEGENIVRPSLKARLREYLELREALRDRGIGFATCKEGLYGLHTAEDCCGLYLLGDYAKRLTLYEFYRETLKRPLRLNAPLKLSGEYLYGERLASYPGVVRRALRRHERRLLRILSTPELLHRLAPEMRVENETLRVEPIGID